VSASAWPEAGRTRPGGGLAGAGNGFERPVLAHPTDSTVTAKSVAPADKYLMALLLLDMFSQRSPI
jgi:hypothetical protein